MMPNIENLAQIAVAHFVNSLPEGILIAAFAWVALRILPRQNSRTRFAVWFLALLAVAGVPFIGTLSRAYSVAGRAGTRSSLFTLSGHWAFILFSVWLLGVLAAGGQLLLGILRLHSLRKSCKAIDPAELDPALAEIARDFSSAHSVTLATSDKVNVPAAIGFFHPMIVIPTWALHELTAEEFRVILLHEFAHLHRRDDWTNLLQKAVRALFIFHPAIWWIERQLSVEREMACDDHVLAETGNPRGYAKCLVALLERSFARRALIMAQAAVRHAGEARQRLSRILDSNRTTSRRFGAPAIGLAGTFSLLCLAIVPHAPELVAFAPSASEIHASSGPAYENSKLAGATVVPAAMHVRSMPVHEVMLHRTQRPSPAPRAIAAKAKSTSIAPRVIKAKANADESAAPAETILVIRTTEQIGPDAWVSHFTVWRLTWVPTRTQSVPPARTT
jgi:beta-lactamase regulating signal transducer with metallopeptidase domain